ncbi:MAG: glutamine-hydrolyzing carbamoyl-phosphate synthase small subunit [Candidatus Omnitrophica bacterium]|nr:glutamine-hydrolyzing carbamoyl-phosphate synthase small subunit [Candidatus Omnitrophota bacterium]
MIIYSQRIKAKLVLEDGSIFSGFSFGAPGTAFGEVVFNTSLSGYQEIITDPSYKGQIVTLTYPLIGNYGVNADDVESRQPFVEAFVVRENSAIASNWRSQGTLSDYLRTHGIVGIEGIDTRALTRLIRVRGEMKAVVSTETLDERRLLEMVKASPGLAGRNLVKEVAQGGVQQWNTDGYYHIVVLDCGVKMNILRELARRKCRVSVAPAGTSAADILALKPQGILLSNGPGDPAAVTPVITAVKKLLGTVPIFGICLGHQMLGLAMGGKTYKLKFGHHGGNHPVKDLRSGRISITSQNHGFCVDLESLKKQDVEVTHINLNDQTLEGFRHRSLPVFSVQFHPEAGPGPNDAKYLFDEFVQLVGRTHA